MTGKPMGLVPGRLDPDTPFRAIANGPAHVLWFTQRDDGRAALSGLLFGELIFSAVTDSTGRPVPNVAWRLDPRGPDADGQTTLDELIENAVRRVVCPKPSGGP